MSRLTLTTTLMLCVFISASGQKTYSTEKDIFEIKEFTFYGYDFSDFKLAEAKRMDEDLTKYLWGWIGLMQDKMTAEKLAAWYRKEKVTPNFGPTIELAKKLKGADLITYTRHLISKDSLQKFIDRYTITEKEGIGLVMIVECFYKKTAHTSGYFVWFDIATKKIILSDYLDQKEADGYGLVNYWGISLGGVSTNYAADYYRKRLKAYSSK